MAEGLPISVAPGTSAGVGVQQVLRESIMQDQWNRLSISTKLKFGDTLLTGLRNGESSQQIARRVSGGVIDGVPVQGFMDTTRKNANTLVRTGSNAVLNRSRLQSFQQNPDLISAIQQVSTLDGRTSEICIAYSGQAWDLQTLEPIGESTLPYNSGPPRHFNCRSTIVPVLKSFEELGLPPVDFPEGTRASVDGQVPGDITFSSFLRGKSRAFQDQLLGQGKARLWREGKITLIQLVDMTGNPLSLRQLEDLVGIRKPPRRTGRLTAAQELEAGAKMFNKVRTAGRNPDELIKATATQARVRASVPDALEDLTDLELSLANHYTRAGYNIWNPFLRATTPNARSQVVADLVRTGQVSEGATAVQVRGSAAVVNRAIGKLPVFEGTVWRGVSVDDPSAVFARYKPGTTVTELGFTSTTTSAEGTFMGNVQFSIQSRTGRQVELLSAFGDEMEVLFRSGTRFRVVEVSNDTIFLTEL